MSLRASPTFVLPILLSLSGCGDSASPVVQELSLTENSNPSVPLAASFYIRTDEPAIVTFRIEGGGAEWTVDPRVRLALEYEIGEAAMEVRQVWQYPGDTGEPFYSSFISDADRLPVTGNVLITSGGLIADSAGVTTEAESGRRSARIIEVTRESPAVSVFDLTVEADWAVGGWDVYRAQRIPSLYPAPQR